MPELPEMENYRLLLSEKVIGKPITQVAVERAKSINVPVDFFQRNTLGASIQSIERRAKHLLFHLNNSKVLVLHLMLGGMMFYGTMQEKPDRSVQITISWGNKHLFFIGLRLGYLHIHETSDIDKLLQKLGPEPLDPNFTQNRFTERIKTQTGTLKSTLVNQNVMSGIGNCYSDEICFEAGLLPARRPSRLSEAETGKLYNSMHYVLKEAVRYGGYMEMPLFAGDDLTGGFDNRCKVYDREGEPCVHCGNPLVRQDVSSKKSFCCLTCQS